MAILPGWNSLESVSYWHNAFNIAGIVVLALLVGTETIAQLYAHRETRLAAVAQTQSERERISSEAETKSRYDQETARIRQQLESARKEAADAAAKADQVKQQQAQRALTEDDKVALITALSPFAGQKVTIKSVLGDADSERFKADFLSVLRAAKWSFDEGTDVSQSIIIPTPSGVQVTINQSDAQAGHVLKSAIKFIQVLHRLGITHNETGFVNAQVPSEVIDLIIGTKPSME